MPRFFINTSQINDSSLYIEGDDSRHIARALRMAVGDSITVCDENGTEYEAELTKIRDDVCEACIISSSVSKSEPKQKITLFMAYPKGDKLETVIQKAVELGAHRIVPFESSRCIKRPAKDKAEQRTERLTKIAEAAAKQCGRASLPTVSIPISYKEAIKLGAEADLPIFCYEGNNAQSLKEVLKSNNGEIKTISVVIGSEGGFSQDEADYAAASGFRIANLGPRILRCETAPDYCLSAISYEFEL